MRDGGQGCNYRVVGRTLLYCGLSIGLDIASCKAGLWTVRWTGRWTERWTGLWTWRCPLPPPHRDRAPLEVAAPPSAHEDWPAARFGVPAHFIFCVAGQKPNPSSTASRPEGQGGGVFVSLTTLWYALPIPIDLSFRVPSDATVTKR